ncbi:MAG: DUF4280 domain-containing protein [Chloroflexota bacterium]
MPQQVVMGGMMACTFGAAPVPIVAAPTGPPVLAGGMQAATIMDFVPIENIPTFGMCSAPTNPVVIAATAAKLGVFTPAPCVPATVDPWVPGVPLVLINKMPALNNTCECLCTWAGVITFTEAGQMTVMD